MLQRHKFPHRGPNRPMSPGMQKATVFLLAIGGLIIFIGFGFVAVMLVTHNRAEPPAAATPVSSDLAPWLLPDDHRIVSIATSQTGTIVLLEDTNGHRAVYALGGAGASWTQLISNQSFESTPN